MKRSSILLQVALVAAIGCSTSTDPVTSTPANENPSKAVATDGSQTPQDTVATTFVSLKVPNMV